MKRVIRWLYWRYAHKGDPWQARLVVYHLSGLADSGHASVGTMVIAQINSQLSGQLDLVAEVALGDLDADRGVGHE